MHLKMSSKENIEIKVKKYTNSGENIPKILKNSCLIRLANCLESKNVNITRVTNPT